MKLSKKGAVTLALILVLFLIASGLMLSRVEKIESSYDEQSKQFELLKEEYNSLSSELEAEKKNVLSIKDYMIMFLLRIIN